MRRRQQGGAAILLAMLVLTLVATLSAAMVWQQQRAVQVEAVERARSQAAWILVAALDWARLILREDGRTGGADHLGEPWAVPLAEARLSSFLAADANNNSVATADSSLEAFLSGSIEDAQGRYNLRNLVNEGKLVPAEQAALQRLFAGAGLSAAQADALADGLLAAWVTQELNAADAAVEPASVADLRWLGLDEASLAALEPLLELLPQRSTLNLNTASAPVIAAVLGIDAGSAQRLAALRERQPFTSVDAARAELPPGFDLGNRASIASSYFIVRGQLRLDGRVLAERSLVERRSGDRGGEVRVLRRERVAASVGGA